MWWVTYKLLIRVFHRQQYHGCDPVLQRTLWNKLRLLNYMNHSSCYLFRSTCCKTGEQPWYCLINLNFNYTYKYFSSPKPANAPLCITLMLLLFSSSVLRCGKLSNAPGGISSIWLKRRSLWEEKRENTRNNKNVSQVT